MAKHNIEKKAAILAASLWRAGKKREAKAVIARMSPEVQQEITDRIVKGIQISQGRN